MICPQGSVILRGVPISLSRIEEIENEHTGKVVMNEDFATYLEKVLRRKKAANPRMAIKTMSTSLMPGVYYVPVEIEIDPFRIGVDTRSGYHIFVECQKSFKGGIVQ